MKDDRVRGIGVLYWSKRRMVLIHLMISSIIITAFLISFLFPILSYRSWGTSDLDYNDDGKAGIDISGVGPGTLYVHAYCINSVVFVPGYDPEEEEYKDLSVDVTVEHCGIPINESTTWIWTKYKLTEKGTCRISAVNDDGLHINADIRYIPKWGASSLCFSCFIIPCLTFTYAAVSLILMRKRKKIQTEHKRYEESILEKKLSRDYYDQRWISEK